MATARTYRQGEDRFVELSSAKGKVAYKVPRDWDDKDADIVVGIAKNAMNLGSIDGTIEELIKKLVEKAVLDRTGSMYFANSSPSITYLETEKRET